MNCMRCGAALTDSVYCPVCGLDNSVQEQAVVISGLYYNEGLEKAQVRDLSGAIDLLRRSLKFNKRNIDARNLLGLVYFETGEVVAALSEWVISNNMQPENNLAAYYIDNLQQDPGRLDVINQTVKKFNIALRNSRNGNEDVAMIQLKKILAQNPKLIKGYHLLALLYMRQEDYDRARKLLKKAQKIDRTNSTTLRFLASCDEALGTGPETETRLPFLGSLFKEEAATEERGEDESRTTRTRADRSYAAGIVGLVIGLLAGILALTVVVVPAVQRKANTEANTKIAEYSAEAAELAATLAEIESAENQVRVTTENAEKRVKTAEQKATSYQYLMAAKEAYTAGELENAANALAEIEPTLLDSTARDTYNMMVNNVPTLLFNALKAKGMAAFENKDYETALSALSKAFNLNWEDKEVSETLAKAQSKYAASQADDSMMTVVPAEDGTGAEGTGSGENGSGETGTGDSGEEAGGEG